MGDIKGIKDGTRGCAFNDRFNFESISSTKTMNMVGFNCLNAESDGKKYLNETYANNHAYFDSNQNCDPEDPCWDSDNISLTYSTIFQYHLELNEYGDALFWIDGSTNFSYNRDYSSECQSFQIQYLNKTIETPNIGCDAVTTTTKSTCSFSDCLQLPCAEEPFSDCINSSECVSPFSYTCDPAPANTNVECTNSTLNQQDSLENEVYRFNCSDNWIISLSEGKDWSFFLNLAAQSANIKLSKLNNNSPQNCNGDICGEGSDACWSSWNFTTVADTGEGAGATSATSQNWRTRVRKVNLEDEELQKYIVTVESKYYLQIPIEDSDPIRILVDSGTDTFSGNQNRGSIHSFTNQDFQAQIGEPVYGCINITRIDRL